LPRLLGSDRDLSRVTLEITEHAAVDDYRALADALAPLRRRGATLAVDDAGAGYSSMRHILHLQPDMIKLDMSITHDVDTDRSRRALAKGLTSFAHEIGSVVVAEGVETAEEFNTLASLGVDLAQGYFFAKPIGPQEALAMGAAI
jgi:EAL domain-containing protein (putative c-di-GMP-specific phosphodiesterase class I)